MNFIRKYNLKNMDICDSLIGVFHQGKQRELTSPGKVSTGVVDREIKVSTDFRMELSDQISPEASNILYEYGQEIVILFDDYRRQLNIRQIDFKMLSMPQIQHYGRGEGFYKWHSDAATSATCQRAFVYITYLNDVKDGGTEFLYQKYTATARKGKTVIFPAGITHTHRGQISDFSDKYIITGWLSFA